MTDKGLNSDLQELRDRTRLAWWIPRDALVRCLAAEGIEHQILAEACGTSVDVIEEVVSGRYPS